ncbi:MAG: flavin reductase family protein [Actinobacteria bacterium]|nr:flavin reductase family protein [Actinomycetota bacterium]
MELRPDQFKLMLPLPVTVITTVDAGGIVNAAPYGCVMPILRPLDLIAVASAPPRHTLKNIRETGEFVVNVMGTPSFDKAMMTAKNYPPEVDELKEVGLGSSPSKEVAPPRIDDALGWIEAVFEQEVTGDRYVLIIGRVVCAEMNDAYCLDGRLTELPALMLSPHYHMTGEPIGDVRETMKLFLGDAVPGQ